MEKIYQIGMFFVLGFALLFILGLPFCVNDIKGRGTKLASAYVNGFFFALSIFEVLQSVFTILNCSFSVLCFSFYILIIVLCVGITVNYKNNIERILKFQINFHRTKEEYILLVFCLIIILAQLVIFVFYRNVQFGDNYFHTAIVTDALETNKLWRVNPATGIEGYPLYWRYKFGGWDMYLAYFAYMTNTRATVFMYTLEPAMVLVLVCAVVYYLSCCLFVNNRAGRYYFCAIMIVLMLFGEYAYASTSAYFMNLPWSGRGMLYTVGVLWVFSLTLREYKKSITREGMVKLLFANISCVSMSFMSFQIILPMELMLYLIYIIRYKKIFSLHRLFLAITPQFFAIGVFVLELKNGYV